MTTLIKYDNPVCGRCKQHFENYMTCFNKPSKTCQKCFDHIKEYKLNRCPVLKIAREKLENELNTNESICRNPSCEKVFESFKTRMGKISKRCNKCLEARRLTDSRRGPIKGYEKKFEEVDMNPDQRRCSNVFCKNIFENYLTVTRKEAKMCNRCYDAKKTSYQIRFIELSDAERLDRLNKKRERVKKMDKK